MITSNNFQAQTDGTTVTTTNSADSGTAFTGIFTNGGAITYDDSQGNMALQTSGVSGSTCFVECTNFGADTEISVAFDYFLSPTKSATRTIFQLRNPSGIVISVLRNTNDTFSTSDAGGAVRWTSTTNYNSQLGEWVRIELQVLSDATSGTFQMSVFPQASSTATEVGTLITGRNTRGGNITTYRAGKVDSSSDAQSDWFDTIRSEDSTLRSLGPVVSAPVSMKQNTAEGGTNGAVVTTANSGGASGDSFAQVTAAGSPSYTFSTNASAHGTRSYRVTGVSGDTAKFYLGDTASSQGSMRGYFYLNALPSSGQAIFNLQNASFGAMVNINLTTTNRLTVLDNGGATIFTGASALSASTWYRIEVQVIAGVSTTTGTINFQYYLGDSTTPIETASSDSANTTTINALRGQFGKINSVSVLDANFDDFAYAEGTSSPIGPYSIANQTPLCNAGSDQSNIEPYTTITLTGTDSDSDGSITTRTWRQISGTAVSLNGAGSSRTYTAPGTIAGTTLVFGYKVTDNGGLDSAEDTVTHAVLPVTERAVLGGVEVPVKTVVVMTGQLV